MIRSTLLAGVALTIVGAAALPADAQNLFRYTRAADALTFDPHAQNEGPTNQLNNQVYEALVERDNDLALIPALAESWRVTDDPSVWSFTLRQGVTFHDGSAFTADDVVFSLNRARGETSDFEGYLSSVAEVRKVDDLTVEIVTDGPNPLLPNNLTNVFMIDQGWAESNGVVQAQNFAGGEETFAVRNANGTGPFRLISREPDNLTVMERFEDYWGNDMFPTEIDRIEFTPITSAPTRVAALLSGEVDYVLDPPVQDLERLEGADGISVSTAPENRVIVPGHGCRLGRYPVGQCRGCEPVRRSQGPSGHLSGHRYRGHPAGGDARQQHPRRGHRAALYRRLHPGARRAPALRPGRGPRPAGRGGVRRRLPGHAALPQRPLRQ